MPLTLRWRGETTLPVEADVVTPDALAGLSAAEAARLPVVAGNARVELGECFAIEGDLSDGHVIVEGSLERVSRIGLGMTGGQLTVRGDAGTELGAGMSGGRIDVVGSVGAWAGAEMRGGMLRIEGNAGPWLGAAYPGSRAGMREGVILVAGAVGDEAGLCMRRGLIAAAGAAGRAPGRAMIAGSILLFGSVGSHAGLGMKRGTLALLGTGGASPPELLPTFAPSGRARPPFLAIYLRQLRDWGFPVPDRAFSGPWDRYNGDLADGGQGEIWVGA